MKNSIMTSNEVVRAIGIDKLRGKTDGLEAYCRQVAYRQSLHGVPNTWSQDSEWLEKGVFEKLVSESGIEKSEDGKQSDADSGQVSGKVTEHSSEEGPYSKIEQLEKLIYLRNKGEITTEEFDDMKKELLS